MEIAGAAAALTAGLAYLDAKFHVRKDLSAISARRLVTSHWTSAVRNKRTSLYYFIESAAQRSPEKPALWAREDVGGCYTWGQTLTRVHQYAQLFLENGVKPGELVGLMMRNSVDFLFAWMGLWAVGAAPAMINHHLTGKALLHCLGVSGAKVVLFDGDEDMRSRLEEVRGTLEEQGVRIVVLDDGTKAKVYGSEGIRPGDELREGTKGDGAMALFYTSGTTGMPKACVLPVIVGHARALGNKNGNFPVKSDDDRSYICMPFYHGTGGITAISQLLNGSTVCIGRKFSVSRFWDDICDSNATWFIYVGETLRYLLAAPPSPRDKDHKVHAIYGNGLRPDVWTKFKERFGIETVHEFFNSTEGMLGLENPCRGEFLKHAVGHHGLLMRWRHNNLFVPVRIDSETGDIARDEKTGFAYRVPYEEGGEILIAVPGEKPFSGYFGNPEATEKKFVRNVFSKGDIWFRTGDMLRRDGDGRWFFKDRLGDTFRWKGENVSTAEVSEVLGKYPGILEANVYGVELPSHDGKAGAAAITIHPDRRHDFNHEDFLKHARTHLPKYAVPIFVRHVTTENTMHNNKQNKQPLKQEGVHPEKVKGDDKIFWIDGYGKGTTYVPFTKQDWEDLGIGKAKL